MSAAAVLRTGRVAAAMALLACVWFWWSALSFGSLKPSQVGGIAIIETALLLSSGLLIRSGISLRKRFAFATDHDRQSLRSFRIVVAWEAAAIIVLVAIALALRHPELAPLFTAIVVGVHFIPLARIFQVPFYALVGAAVIVWCLFCWIVFRGNLVAAYGCFGTGTLLWALSAWQSIRGWQVVRSLRA